MSSMNIKAGKNSDLCLELPMLRQIIFKLLGMSFIPNLSIDLLLTPLLLSSLQYLLTLSVTSFLDFTKQKISNHPSNLSLKQISCIDVHKSCHAQYHSFLEILRLLLILTVLCLYFYYSSHSITVNCYIFGSVTRFKLFEMYQFQELQLRILYMLKKHLLSKCIFNKTIKATDVTNVHIAYGEVRRGSADSLCSTLVSTSIPASGRSELMQKHHRRRDNNSRQQNI